MKKLHHLDIKTKKIIQNKITRFLRDEDNILFAYLHGSFLTESFRDMDLGIYLKSTLSKKKY